MPAGTRSKGTAPPPPPTPRKSGRTGKPTARVAAAAAKEGNRRGPQKRNLEDYTGPTTPRGAAPEDAAEEDLVLEPEGEGTPTLPLPKLPGQHVGTGSTSQKAREEERQKELRKTG